MKFEKVLQIVSADGWYAEFRAEGGQEFTLPLAVWALVDEGDGETGVVGMVGNDYVYSAEANDDFVRYTKEPIVEMPVEEVKKGAGTISGLVLSGLMTAYWQDPVDSSTRGITKIVNELAGFDMEEKHLLQSVVAKTLKELGFTLEKANDDSYGLHVVWDESLMKDLALDYGLLDFWDDLSDSK